MTCHYPDLGSVSNWPKKHFPRDTTSRKQQPALGSDTSSVWNFCARSSAVISCPKVALQNVSCILRLTVFRWRDCTVIKLLFTGKSTPKEIKAHSPLVHQTTQPLRMDYDTIRFLTGNSRKTACIMIASGNETCSRPVNAA